MVAVINFGGQYAHLIARRIRELGVKSELLSPNITSKDIKKILPDAIIFSGSPYSSLEKDAPKINPSIYKLNIPILGICYGHQLMASQLGGKVQTSKVKQYGRVNLKLKKSAIFNDLKSEELVWFSHGDQVKKLPPGFESIAETINVPIAASQNKNKNFYSLQFHPEVTHTPSGMKILSNFIFNIAKAKKDWDLPKIKLDLIKKIKQEVGKEKVIMALSGGVDSLVAANLIHKAIGAKLFLVLIDTGLLRKNEVEEVINIVKLSKLPNLHIVSASERFLKALNGIIEPEDKRKTIADLYFRIFEEEAKRIGDVSFLGQGTIYPDRVESAETSKHADKIKSHHNVTLPKGLKLKLIEPLKDFYKDEVRKIGKLLAISEEFIKRHPFPGPALAIRILGEVNKERLSILKEADSIFIEELKNSGIYNKVGQSFAALIPLKAVGVKGDARTYSYLIALRSVDTQDFMTADWSKLPQSLLEKVSSRIVNEVEGVNRVLYDITQKPPATIEYE